MKRSRSDGPGLFAQPPSTAPQPGVAADLLDRFAPQSIAWVVDRHCRSRICVTVLERTAESVTVMFLLVRWEFAVEDTAGAARGAFRYTLHPTVAEADAELKALAPAARRA